MKTNYGNAMDLLRDLITSWITARRSNPNVPAFEIWQCLYEYCEQLRIPTMRAEELASRAEELGEQALSSPRKRHVKDLCTRNGLGESWKLIHYLATKRLP